MKYLSVHFTDMCNSRCVFCVVASPSFKEDEVNYIDIVRFLTQYKDKGFSTVIIHGGEPTIHPKFLQTVRLILGLGYKDIHLQTNGIKLERKDFCKRLIDLSVTKFVVSIHGDNAQIHDSQTRTPGGFDKTIRGIKNLKALSAHIHTNTVISLQNVTRLEAIALLACELGIERINFSNLHPVGSVRNHCETIMARLGQIREGLYPAIDAARRLGCEVTLEGFPYCSIRGEGRERLHVSNQRRAITMFVHGIVVNDYERFMREDMRVIGEPCKYCTVKELCGGVYPQYIDGFGWSEFSAVEVLPFANGFVEVRR